MEFCGDFDDDFFEKPKERKLTKPENYEPNILKPFWFMDTDLKVKDSKESLDVLKHQADHYYISQSYANALKAYQLCLELVPANNGTWQREVMENLARVHLKLDQPEKALEWSFKLDKIACSPDQKIASMNLLATVCHRLGKYAEELEALHCCLEVHKLCPEFWQRLALCYAGMFKLSLPDYPLCEASSEDSEEACCDFKVKRNVRTEKLASTNSTLVCPEESPECATESTKCELCLLGIQIVSSCLIRTRMLIDSSGSGIFTKDRDDRTKEKIANSLKYMEVDKDFIDVASQMLGGEFSSILQNHESSLEQLSSLSKHKEKDHTNEAE